MPFDPSQKDSEVGHVASSLASRSLNDVLAVTVSPLKWGEVWAERCRARGGGEPAHAKRGAGISR